MLFATRGRLQSDSNSLVSFAVKGGVGQAHKHGEFRGREKMLERERQRILSVESSKTL